MKRLTKLETALDRFFFAPASPRPLAWLRIGLALTLLIQAALVGPDVFQLYGRSGWLQGALGDYFNQATLPGLSSILRSVAVYGVGDHAVILSVSMVYLVVLVGMLVGFASRVMMVLAWATHLVITGGQLTSYGVDQYANVFLFYLMFSPAGHALSLDQRWDRVNAEPSSAARFFLRAVQLQLCLSYFAAGADKAMGEQWWNGEAIWRALMLPMYCPYDFSWLAKMPWLARLATWGTLVVEMGYIVFIWPQRTRKFWVAAALGMHFGIAVLMGLGTFSLAMSLFTLSAFAVSAEVMLPSVPQFISPFRLRLVHKMQLTPWSHREEETCPNCA